LGLSKPKKGRVVENIDNEVLGFSQKVGEIRAPWRGGDFTDKSMFRGESSPQAWISMSMIM
jgi:hypothetical protein